jgi:hypothetical protein
MDKGTTTYAKRLGICLLLLVFAPVAKTDALTTEQQELVDFGLSRFEEQGLTLPEIQFEFFSTSMDCEGRLSVFFHRTSTLRMCSLDKGTLLHELAHGWSRAALTKDKKQEFMELRGIGSWNDRSQARKEERGIEHAAEVIAWALLDEPNSQLFLTDDPNGQKRLEFRLLNIETVESLHDAFLQLTGLEPVFRLPSEWDSEALYADWQTHMSSYSPEARRLENGATEALHEGRIGDRAATQGNAPTHDELIAEVQNWYASAGFTLPEIEVSWGCETPPSERYPFDVAGTFNGTTICMFSHRGLTLAHEYAHAWEMENLTDAQRIEFMELAGQDTWLSHDVSYGERAGETLARVLAWWVVPGERSTSKFFDDWWVMGEWLSGQSRADAVAPPPTWNRSNCR